MSASRHETKASPAESTDSWLWPTELALGCSTILCGDDQPSLSVPRDRAQSDVVLRLWVSFQSKKVAPLLLAPSWSSSTLGASSETAFSSRTAPSSRVATRKKIVESISAAKKTLVWGPARCSATTARIVLSLPPSRSSAGGLSHCPCSTSNTRCLTTLFAGCLSSQTTWSPTRGSSAQRG